ncbi:hypothetical protein RUM43_012341 [Polyplax serrata]|uniref:BPL/LPL catalytic domain-containing protein n=1 Tax=Polyplax serrata TaxID=468196 RepID=A0AAN8NRG9_POLSC
MAFIISKSVFGLDGAREYRKFAVVLNGTANYFARYLSTEKRQWSSQITKNEDDISKSVFVSQSNDIFTNLAIENWLYKHKDFNKHHVLLIWRNDPCVVIGRHQNPWVESNIKYLGENGMDLARRNSGGGTVYHDRGNINLSFFTPRERYNRKHNLRLIKQALKKEFNLDIEISDKDDLLLDNMKVSGTASKLGRPNAYHHCTLLVNANKSHLKETLNVNKSEFQTNATKSVPSHTKNLVESNAHVSFERLLPAIGWEFLRTTAISQMDGGTELINKQIGFHLINPIEHWFPGLNELRDEFTSWDWRFGKTPKFTVTRSFPIPADSPDKVTGPKMNVSLRVEKGEILDISVKLPPGMSESVMSWCDHFSSLQGKKYSSQTFELIEKSLSVIEKEKVKEALRA